MRKIEGSNVAVIGGAGFLGSHIVNYLIENKNCEVTVLDNLINGQRKHIHNRSEFIYYDIRDNYQDLIKIFNSHKIQFVINYAAEPYIPECFERPLHFFDINAVAVLKVLNAVQESMNVEGLLQVSSAEIYGDAVGKVSEDYPVRAHSTYGVSKMAADGLVQVRWREAQVPAIALRQFNCVGERETHDYVVPEIISQLAKQRYLFRNQQIAQGIVKLGNNSARDFLYAGDAVRMAVELLEKGDFGEVYNIGSEESTRIYDLPAMLGQCMGFNEVTVQEDPSRIRPWEIWHLQSDNSKMYSVIDARPEIPLPKALSKTVNYFVANGNKWDW